MVPTARLETFMALKPCGYSGYILCPMQPYKLITDKILIRVLKKAYVCFLNKCYTWRLINFKNPNLEIQCIIYLSMIRTWPEASKSAFCSQIFDIFASSDMCCLTYFYICLVTYHSEIDNTVENWTLVNRDLKNTLEG